MICLSIKTSTLQPLVLLELWLSRWYCSQWSLLGPLILKIIRVLMDASCTVKVTTSIQGGSSRISIYIATSSQVGNNTKLKWSLEDEGGNYLPYLHDGIDASCNIMESILNKIVSNLCPTLLMINLKSFSECHRATDACRTTKFIRLFTTLQPIFQPSL